jgi:hypothetical protein
MRSGFSSSSSIGRNSAVCTVKVAQQSKQGSSNSLQGAAAAPTGPAQSAEKRQQQQQLVIVQNSHCCAITSTCLQVSPVLPLTVSVLCCVVLADNWVVYGWASGQMQMCVHRVTNNCLLCCAVLCCGCSLPARLWSGQRRYRDLRALSSGHILIW